MGMSCFTVFSDSRLWDCRVFTLFPYRQVRCDCIFTGFADNRLWEYRIFLKTRSILYAFLPGVLNPVHGNVVFSRSKLRAHHKSLVFFRSLLLPAVANLMFCMSICVYLCDSLRMRCIGWQAVPEAS